jgi:uncharacterized protein YggU (UPF0235/DUF167 family)
VTAQPDAAAFWRVLADGVRVAVKVQPKSRRPGVQGRVADQDGARLRIGVCEAAEDGRANRAACALLADAIGVPHAAIGVHLGATSRQKTLHVAGDPVLVAARLATL